MRINEQELLGKRQEIPSKEKLLYTLSIKLAFRGRFVEDAGEDNDNANVVRRFKIDRR